MDPKETRGLASTLLMKKTISSKISCEVGVEGGRLEVGGCVVEIPPNSLDQSTLIGLISYYGSPQDEVSMSPILSCAPHGLKFLKPIKITLPTCFVTEDNNPAQVVVRHSNEGDEWLDYMTLMYRNDGCVSFEATHFSFWSILGFVGITVGWLKTKSITFSKPKWIDFPKEAELFFKVCDSVQTSNMELYEYNFRISRFQQNLPIQFQMEDSESFEVEPTSFTMTNVFSKSKLYIPLTIKRLKHDQPFKTKMFFSFPDLDEGKKHDKIITVEDIKKSLRFSNAKITPLKVDLDVEVCDEGSPIAAGVFHVDKIVLRSTEKDPAIKFKLEDETNFVVKPSQISLENILSCSYKAILRIKKKTDKKLPPPDMFGFSIQNLEGENKPVWINIPGQVNHNPYA